MFYMNVDVISVPAKAFIAEIQAPNFAAGLGMSLEKEAMTPDGAFFKFSHGSSDVVVLIDACGWEATKLTVYCSTERPPYDNMNREIVKSVIKTLKDSLLPEVPAVDITAPEVQATILEAPAAEAAAPEAPAKEPTFVPIVQQSPIDEPSPSFVQNTEAAVEAVEEPTPAVETAPAPEEHTRFCYTCGNPILGDALFCSTCGIRVTPLRKNVCKNCGTELTEGAHFCYACGAQS